MATTEKGLHGLQQQTWKMWPIFFEMHGPWRSFFNVRLRAARLEQWLQKNLSFNIVVEHVFCVADSSFVFLWKPYVQSKPNTEWMRSFSLATHEWTLSGHFDAKKAYMNLPTLQTTPVQLFYQRHYITLIIFRDFFHFNKWKRNTKVY